MFVNEILTLCAFAVLALAFGCFELEMRRAARLNARRALAEARAAAESENASTGQRGPATSTGKPFGPGHFAVEYEMRPPTLDATRGQLLGVLGAREEPDLGQALTQDEANEWSRTRGPQIREAMASVRPHQSERPRVTLHDHIQRRAGQRDAAIGERDDARRSARAWKRLAKRLWQRAPLDAQLTRWLDDVDRAEKAKDRFANGWSEPEDTES